jgi:hypothetical protein
MSNSITPQLIGHDLSWLTWLVSYQTPERPFRSCPITTGLQIGIHHLTVLVHGPPQIMLLAIDRHKDFIDVESITVATMSPLQSSSVYSSELDTPEANRLSVPAHAWNV